MFACCRREPQIKTPSATTTSTKATATKTKMPAILNYFGFPGRGEATRVALTLAGVDFEDKRMSFEEFGVCSFKALPVYQVQESTRWSLRLVFGFFLSY